MLNRTNVVLFHLFSSSLPASGVDLSLQLKYASSCNAGEYLQNGVQPQPEHVTVAGVGTDPALQHPEIS